jgi:Ca2+-binding RTX toxin-like protein
MAFVHGTKKSETIDANDGVTNGLDIIYGHDGNDKIWGLGGNDTISGGNGADEINGGSGIDTASYVDSAVEGVYVNLTTGEGFGGTAEGDTFSSIENLTGSPNADTLVGDGGSNELSGQDGEDSLKGGGGSDTLYGLSGNDELKGGGGADAIHGGSGIDTASYRGSSAGVVISLITDDAFDGDAEGDELNSIENLIGSSHDDVLFGDNVGANVLSGEDGDDVLKGFGGADTLKGGDGGDLIAGGAGGDNLNGGSGTDTLSYTDSTSGVKIHLGANTASGGEATGDTIFSFENVTGSSHGDELRGNSLANRLEGGDGNDVFDGGGGADTLVGGDGNDSFGFQAGQAHNDTVTDFDGNGALAGDQLVFAGYGPGATFSKVNATTWEIVYDGGASQETIKFSNAAAITASDYVFI